MKKENIIIRNLLPEEYNILEDLLYEAIFQPEGVELLPREIIKNPDIWAYINNWGNENDDCCFVAESDNQMIGAVWVRIISGDVKGYGNIDEQTPEFAISLFPRYRNKGIGTLLMKKMIGYLKEKGYQQTSLSVDKNNYAVKMYQKLGFIVVQEREHDYLMLLNL